MLNEIKDEVYINLKKLMMDVKNSAKQKII